MKLRNNTAKAFSLVEILLAGALFTVFSTGVYHALFAGFEADRIGEETMVASEYAASGMDAIRSIGAADFSALDTVSASGIDEQGSTLSLSGTHDSWGIYTRTVSISDVRRDSDGEIDEQKIGRAHV